MSAAIVILAVFLFLMQEIYRTHEASNDSGLSDYDPDGHGKLALIIDDFGQNRSGVEEMMSIQRHVTFAIMPFLQFSEEDAKEAYEKGYEVIVHLPLEATNSPMSWVGPRPILTSMTDEEIKALVRDAFESVPHAAGANIHMGSRAGCDEHVIASILDVIKEKNLYFVDSRSEPNPIAKQMADLIRVRCFERNFFLDGKKPKDYIKHQLEKAEDYALRKGYAIAIGHVGTEGGKITAEAISEMLDDADKRHVDMVYVSEIED